METSSEILNAYVLLYTDLESCSLETEEQVSENRRDGRRFSCNLCNQVESTREKLEFHLQEKRHHEALERLRHDMDLIRVVMQRYTLLFTSDIRMDLSIASKIGCQKWIDPVQASIYRYLTTSPLSNVDDNSTAYLHRLRNRVDTKLMNEGLVILELAVWRAQCILQLPKNADCLTAMQWTNAGWKASKAAQQVSAAMRTIVKNVALFLRPHGDSELGTYLEDEHPGASARELVRLKTPWVFSKNFLAMALRKATVPSGTIFSSVSARKSVVRGVKGHTRVSCACEMT
jgi:hypothetical protein